MSDAISENGLRGRAWCVVPGLSAAVAIAAWLGRALAVGVRRLLGWLDVEPCGIVCRSLCGLTHSPSTRQTGVIVLDGRDCVREGGVIVLDGRDCVREGVVASDVRGCVREECDCVRNGRVCERRVNQRSACLR